MDIEQRRLSDADIQSLSLPVQNDLTAIFGVMQDATDRLLDTAVKEGWTPDEYIAAVMRMINGDNTAQETTAAPAAQEIRVNKAYKLDGRMTFQNMPVSIENTTGMSKEDAAKRAWGAVHNASKDMAEKDAGIGVIDPEELRMGTKEEMEEHNLPLAGGMKIALDHLRKRPDYYSAMKKAGF